MLRPGRRIALSRQSSAASLRSSALSHRRTWWFEAIDAYLADFFAPGFQILFHLRHELVGYCAVDQAVIVAEGQVNYGADGDGVVAVLVSDDQRHFGDAAYAHDGR